MGTNRALLVGINEYMSGNNLRGCENDVDNICGILIERYKFDIKDIVILKSREATNEAIRGHLKELVAKTESYDWLFNHFSGHGSRCADLNNDEADGLDELICPYDMQWGTKTYITDDDLAKIFSALPKDSLLEVVYDSCNSGTLSRSSYNELDQGASTRYYPSPQEGRTGPIKTLKSSVRNIANHVWWSGCGANQTSADAYLGGSFNGAFTYYWVKVVRANPTMGRRNVLKTVLSEMRGKFTQIPELQITT